MLTQTTYVGDDGRRCDGCGLAHVNAGSRIYRVRPGDLVIADECIVPGALRLTKLAHGAARAWEQNALDLGSASMLRALDELSSD
jgi:hypothetical protein